MIETVELKTKLAGEIVDILCGVWNHGPEGTANDIVEHIYQRLGLEALK